MRRSKKTSQLEFETVLDTSFRTHERKMIAYFAEHVETYRGFAQLITPCVADPLQSFTRVAFAILSANCVFNSAVQALDVVVEKRGAVTADEIAPYGMVPLKARAVNELWEKLAAGYPIGKLETETWSEYRYRLKKEFVGLGTAKASFSVALLYPREADVACVDTWMQKVFLGNTGFEDLSNRTYELIEARVRRYAKRFGVSTFLAQWIIWDHARGGKPNSHAIFPGTHKASESEVRE